MDLATVCGLLSQKTAELQSDFPLTWRYPKRVPANPKKARPKDSWPVWDGRAALMKKNEKNWFYADLVFPKAKNGIALANTEGWFFIHGWSPFTLWLDGVELFKEEHPWYATGPIADPVVAKIEPGRTYRLVMCVEPTELPAGMVNLVNVGVKSKVCYDMSIETGAAFTQLRLAEAYAKTDAEKKLVAEAAECINTAALEKNNWKLAADDIQAMEAKLEPLSDRVKAMTVHIVGHSHIDMDWMWTWPDTEHCIRRDFKAMTDMLEDYPDLTFVHSQVPTYDVVRKKDPSVFKKVQRFIEEGRWENAAGTWVEGDLNMADGESVARHMLYAADWTQKHLNSKAKVLWEPDTFGHPGNMPQLAKLGEHDCYFHMRGNPGYESNWPIRTWIGVDGTPITAFSVYYNASLHPDNILGNILDSHRFGLKHALHMWGVGDHGGGMSRYQLALLELYHNKPLIPTIKCSTISNLLKAIQDEKAELPSNKGMTYSLFEGCFTTHALIKKYNRMCEGALLTSEALSALAGLDSKAALRDAWTDMLFNHFHDIFDGAAVHDSYINAYERAEASLKTAASVSKKAASMIVKKGSTTLTVINQLGFERTEPVAAALPKNTRCLIDATGKAVPVQQHGDMMMFVAEKIPALGTATYRIVTKASDVPADYDQEAIDVRDEHGYLRIDSPFATARVSKESGVIGSYLDKRLGRELVAYGVPKHLTHVATSRAELGLNVFQVIDEAPNPMSAWLINDNLKQENLLRGGDVTLVQAGPVFAQIRVVHKFRASSITENIFFYKKLGRVDFEATVDWRERGNNEVGVPQLKVSFATSMAAPRAKFEGPFFITERIADGIEQPTGKWVDVTGDDFGLALYNDSKHGCDVLGGRARLTLLRNSYGPDAESDNGVHIMRFAFEPHPTTTTNADLLREATAFNRPPVALRTGDKVAAAKACMTVDGTEAVVCTSVRLAEHSSKVVVRFFETSGREQTATIGVGKEIKAAEEVNFLENPTGGKVDLKDGRVTVRFHPFEVKTLLLDVKL